MNNSTYTYLSAFDRTVLRLRFEEVMHWCNRSDAGHLPTSNYNLSCQDDSY